MSDDVTCNVLPVFAERLVDFSGHADIHRLPVPRRMKFRVGHGSYLIGQVWSAAVPGSGVAYQHAAGGRRADGAELHPLRLFAQFRNFLLAVLGARDLSGGPINGGKIAGQKLQHT